MSGAERLMGHRAVKAYLLVDYSLADSTRRTYKQGWKQFMESGAQRLSGNAQGLALRRVDMMNFILQQGLLAVMIGGKLVGMAFYGKMQPLRR